MILFLNVVRFIPKSSAVFNWLLLQVSRALAIRLFSTRDKIFEYNKILENLLNQKDEFIGQLGHDLKNPLQPIVGLLPMLIEQEKDPMQIYKEKAASISYAE